jgi:cytochrome c
MKASIAAVAGLLLAGVIGCGEPASEGDRYAAEPVGRGGPADECVVCHSLAKGGTLRSAPPLWGIVGAPKARFDWFGYSPALARAGGVWTEEELDAYLADPDAFLPGTKKSLIGIPDERERAEVIAFLASLAD